MKAICESVGVSRHKKVEESRFYTEDGELVRTHHETDRAKFGAFVEGQMYDVEPDPRLGPDEGYWGSAERRADRSTD